MSESRTDVTGGEFADVSGIVLAHLLAPVLADLDSVPDGPEGNALLVDVVTALARLKAYGDAQLARVVALLRARTRDEVTGTGSCADGAGVGAGRSHAFQEEVLADRMVATDIALATGVTSWSADRDLALAELIERHPNLYRGLASGRVDRRRVEILARELGDGLDPTHPEQEQQAARIVAKVVGVVGDHSADEPDAESRAGLIRELRRDGTNLMQLPTGTFTRAVRREVAAIAGPRLTERSQRAAAGRRVTARSLPDCMGELVITAPGIAIAQSWKNIELTARALKAQGDPRSMDQLRTDITLGWTSEGATGTLVIRPTPTPTPQDPDPDPVPEPEWSAIEEQAGRDPRFQPHPGRPARVIKRIRLPRPKAAMVVITMDEPTATGRSNQPAALHGLPGGPVPIPAAWARDQLTHTDGSTECITLTLDPVTKTAVGASNTYRPPPRLARYIRLRDGLISRTPGTSTNAVELDHITPYRPAHHHDPEPLDGQTSRANLASQDRRAHHLKTDRALDITGDADGALTITTHTGHHYISWPEPWEEQPAFLDATLAHQAITEARERDEPPPW